MRLWKRSAWPKSWNGNPTLTMKLKDPFHVVRVTPHVSQGIARVHLWVQSGGMGGTVFLAEDEARRLAKGLLDAVEEANSAAVVDEPEVPS